MQHFASDNYAGICPEALSALLAANEGHVRSYGDDEWTLRVADRLRELFETDCDVYFVFNGTAANSLALAALCQPYHSVICHQLAHVDTDECGAPQFFSNGAKLLAVAGEQGKLTPASIVEVVTRRTDIHYPKPKVVTLTQATEVGTVYRPDELRAIANTAREHGLRVHMDGARFANAVAGLAQGTGLPTLFPVQANGVFVHLPSRVEEGLRQRGWLFYNFIAAGGARFMCGWDTAPETVDRLLADIRELAAEFA